jgi:hypothetical protein
MPEVEPRYSDCSSSSLVIVVDLSWLPVLLVEVEGHVEIFQYNWVIVYRVQWAVCIKYEVYTELSKKNFLRPSIFFSSLIESLNNFGARMGIKTG